MSARRLTPLVLLTVAFCGPGLSESDLYCEEAARNLEVCCGFQATHLTCEDQPVGCDPPRFDDARGRCLASQPCFYLQQTGYCAWAEKAFGPTPPTYLPPEPELCR
ncbi:MAG: hypothetical protein U0229_17300 [Anaeromyxobacter sp.]